MKLSHIFFSFNSTIQYLVVPIVTYSYFLELDHFGTSVDRDGTLRTNLINAFCEMMHGTACADDSDSGRTAEIFFFYLLLGVIEW